MAILSTSTYKQNKELYNSLPKTNDKSEIERFRYAKYPNELFAWEVGIAVLINFIVADLNLNNTQEILTSVLSFDFSTEYTDSILMLLNYMNVYNQFNVISVLSLSQIIFFLRERNY